MNKSKFLILGMGLLALSLVACAKPQVESTPTAQAEEVVPAQVVKNEIQPTTIDKKEVASVKKTPPAPKKQHWKMVKGKIVGSWPHARVLEKIKNPKTPGFTTDTCWDFDGFAVVESRSTDEVGSAEVIVRRGDSARCAKSFKGQADSLRITEGHFAGVAGPMLVIEGDDNSEGLLEFQIFEVATGKELFKTYHNPNAEFELHENGGLLSLDFYAKVKVTCELGTGDKECWARVLKENKVKRPTPMPDCKVAYQKAKISEFEPALVTVRARVADLRHPAVDLVGGGSATCAPQP